MTYVIYQPRRPAMRSSEEFETREKAFDHYVTFYAHGDEAEAERLINQGRDWTIGTYQDWRTEASRYLGNFGVIPFLT